MKDWTQNKNGRTNNSPRFEFLVDQVDAIIRQSGHALIHGDSAGVARLIMAQLAHVHNMGPLPDTD